MRQNRKMPGLILGNENVIFLEALATLLAGQGYQVGEVTASTAATIAAMGRMQPDACLIDCHAVGADEMCAIGQVASCNSGTAVLVLGTDPRSEAADRALDAGAAGYLHQSRGVSAVFTLLPRVVGGEVVVDVPGVPMRGDCGTGAAQTLAWGLTERERECLMMHVEGLDTAAMVERLGIARTTVRTHLQSVLTKLGVHSRLEAASFALRHGLVEPLPPGPPCTATCDARRVRPSGVADLTELRLRDYARRHDALLGGNPGRPAEEFG